MDKTPKNIKRLLIVIALLGVALSLLTYGWVGGRNSIFYLGIMPGLPFITISLVGFLYRHQVAAGSLWGASTAALIITVLAYGALYYESLTYTYNGGGAIIGFGMLLLIPLPIFYAFTCWLGWFIGGKICRS
ncbi:hypothetical protein [Idiomarina sp. HP20-50]|uniref:hypothetical protein n=1 Tax=Idiomarina sp. HP20-50 TaxID=3070813 RepID=UPI00294B7C1A|nr:hypothetical protein [Idiomarina sp. HP20-50]MDV6315334.1 hypothetical protein [Idiomarina sp. HP20-50]